MQWLAVIRGLVSLAVYFTQYLRETELMQAGEDKEVARGLALLQERLKIGHLVDAEVAKMNDTDVDKELGQ